MQSRIAEILSFWFGDSFVDGMPEEPRHELWFGFTAETDKVVKEKFEADVLKAVAGDYDDWANTAEGRIALIILIDQLTRNIYRGSAEAFAYDDIALRLCLEGLERGHDKQLIPIHRVFFYLPLEHQESVEHQQLCIDLYQELKDTVPESIQTEIKKGLDYAIDHKKIIDRFGRFPHRNAILGRESTPEEIEYLATSSNDFGQGG